MQVFPTGRVITGLALGALVATPLAVLAVARRAWWLVAAVVAGWALHAVLVLRVPWRRWKAVRRPFPNAWRTLLEERVPFYRRLDDQGRRRFENDVAIIIAEYHFEGVRGTRVDDELRLLAASGAATLLHGRPRWELPGRRSVIIYPESFDDDYRIGPAGHLAGMVQHQGAVVFSEPALRHGWSGDQDGHNVAVHEFAHVLDLEDGDADGIPEGLRPSARAPWLALMRDEMDKVHRGRSVLRRYASTNDAEFFAVAAEVFFERPHAMRERHPELYGALTDLFGFDPAAAVPGEGAHRGDT